ncbi:MAG TPA: hypothetical protein VM452_15340 [Caulifigura sp.]|nr:hypothetical protein [Caulifigura sp.]
MPGNDDSIRSIALIMNYLGDAVAAGKATLPQKPEEQKVAADEPKAVPNVQ